MRYTVMTYQPQYNQQATYQMMGWVVMMAIMTMMVGMIRQVVKEALSPAEGGASQSQGKSYPQTKSEGEYELARTPPRYRPVKRLVKDKLYVLYQPDYKAAKGEWTRYYMVVSPRAYRPRYFPKVDLLGEYIPSKDDLFIVDTGGLKYSLEHNPPVSGVNLLREMEREPRSRYRAFYVKRKGGYSPQTEISSSHLPQLVRYSDGYQRTIAWEMIDPGMRWVVAALNERDYETFNSCEGHPGRIGASYVTFMTHSHKRWEAIINFAVDYAQPMGVERKVPILVESEESPTGKTVRYVWEPSFYGDHFDSCVYEIWAEGMKFTPEYYPPTTWKEAGFSLFVVYLTLPQGIGPDEWNEVRDRFWGWFIRELDRAYIKLKAE